MENGKAKNPPEQLSESHITSVYAGWLTANIEDMNQRCNQIQELIENGAELFADKSDDGYERQCQLISHVEEIVHKHQLLAEQLEQFRSCNDNLSAFNQQNVGDSTIGFANCFQTPDTKSLGHHVNAEAPSTVPSQMFGGSSSETSGKEDSEYSAIFSDSDSETYNLSAYESARSHLDAHRVLEHHFVNKVDGRAEERLERSEKEVFRLQKELTGTFESHLVSAQNELKKQEITCGIEKKKVVKLQNDISVLEDRIVNSNTRIGSLVMELDLANLKLESSEEEITYLRSYLNKNSDYSLELKNQLELAQQQLAMLDAKLDREKRQASEMQDRIQQYISDISNREYLIQNLKFCLQEVTDQSHEDEVEFQSRISSLTDHLMRVEASGEERENRCESLEEHLQQCEAVMTEMQRLHEVQEIKWKTEIDLCNTKLNEKIGSVEILKKGLDTLKLKYDVLEAEKVGANRMIQALEADLGSKESQIRQMDRSLQQLQLEKRDLILVSDSSRKQYEDVRLKLKNLEKRFRAITL